VGHKPSQLDNSFWLKRGTIWPKKSGRHWGFACI